MDGAILTQMKSMNKMLSDFIELNKEAKREATRASEEAEKAAKRQTATMKALNIAYNRNGKLLRDGTTRVNEYGQEVSRVGEVISKFNKRTTVLSQSIEVLNKSGKSFEIFSKATRKAYREAGGNMWEFWAEAIAGTREEITIFGQEGAKIRKVMYGFMPPGTFRALNKVSSVLQAVGSATRRAQRSTSDYKEDIKKLTDAQKALKKSSPTYEDDYKNLEESKNKMLEDMKADGGGSIIKTLGVGLKALGKIPRLGKFRAGFAESREQSNLQAQASILTKLGFAGLGMNLDDVKARRTELKSKTASRYGSGQGFRTAEEDAELQALNDILKPISAKGFFSDALLTGIKNSPIVAISKGVKASMVKTAQFFRFMRKNMKEGVMKFIKMASKFIYGLMIYLTLFAALIFLFKRPIKNTLKFVSEFIKDRWPAFKNSLIKSFTFIKDGFFDIYEGLMSGDLMEIMLGLWKVVWGLLGVAFKVVGATLTVLFAAASVFIGDFFQRVYEWVTGTWADFKNGEGMKAVKKIALGIAVIVGLFVGWPFIIGAAITTGIALILKFIGSKLGFFASGGTVNKPFQVVGERGPEMVALPQGSRVFSNRESRKMGGGVVNNFNITVNAKDSSKAEMRRMADEIGRMINSKINRSTSSSTLR